MISYKAREKIRNEFVDFNKRYNTKVYPTTKAIQNTENKLDGVVQQYNRLPKTVTPFKPEKEEVLQKEVYYSGKKKLIVDRGEILNLDVDVDLCVYCIAKKNINPFLLFSLFKNEYRDHHLSWLTINIKDKNLEDIITILRDKLKGTPANIVYEGKYTYNERLQLWFSCDDISDIVNIGKYNDTQFWSTSSEIINYKKLLTFSINYNIVDFFLENNDFLYLKNDLGDIYESPTIAYYGNHANRITFAANVGIMRAQINSIFGPYYYYANYEKAIEYASKTNKIDSIYGVPSEIEGEKLVINDKGQLSKGGLLRSVIFLGDIVVANIEEEKGISWVSKGNSIISQSKLEKEKPDILYVIENFENQFPLERYYIASSKYFDEDIKKITVD